MTWAKGADAYAGGQRSKDTRVKDSRPMCGATHHCPRRANGITERAVPICLACADRMRLPVHMTYDRPPAYPNGTEKRPSRLVTYLQSRAGSMLVTFPILMGFGLVYFAS